MADHVNLMNFLIQCIFSRRDFINGQFINLNFIIMRCYLFRPSHTWPSRHSNLTFAVSMMLNFLEIKYLGKTESPFETHPKIMFFAVTSLILYCFSYDANLRVSSSTTGDDHISSNGYVCVIGISIAFFGPLSLASLSSVLFPDRLCPVLFSVSILFSLCELGCCKFFRILWNLVKQVIRVTDVFPAELNREGRRGGGRRRRRRRVPASVYLPRLSVWECADESLEQEDINTLPV